MNNDDDTDGDFKAERLPSLLAGVPNLSEFSRVSGVSRKMLERYRAGMEPSFGKALRIARALGVPLDALVSDVYVANQDAGVSHDVSDSIAVSMLDVVAAAGGGIPNDGEREITKLPFSRALLKELGAKPEKCHFIRARGDSMEPTIHDGDVVLIDIGRSKDREDGIYVLMFGEDARIKRCFFGAMGNLTLVSDNSAYPDEILGRADREQIKIVGKVIWTGGAP